MLGGATTFLLNFLRALQDHRDTLRITAIAEENEHASDFAILGAKVSTGPVQRMIYEDRLAWAYHQVARGRPNAILACLGAESYEILRLAPPGVVRIGLIQSDDPLPYAMARHYGAWTDAIVGVSSQITARLKTLPEFEGTTLATIPYGIAFPESPARPKRATGGPLRVIYLGRIIEEQKRISRLAELIHLLREEPIQWTIAGSGPDEEEFRSAVAGEPRVSLLGTVANRDVPALLREHDVYILLSDYEGLPLSLLEAMGHGVVPVISDLASGIGQAVVEGTGMRVPVGDVGAAADILRMLVHNPAILANLSEAAAHHARTHFSAETMASRYLELIHSLSPNPHPVWLPRVPIPTPRGVRLPWLYSGLPRHGRRWLKNLHPLKGRA